MKIINSLVVIGVITTQMSDVGAAGMDDYTKITGGWCM